MNEAKYGVYLESFHWYRKRLEKLVKDGNVEDNSARFAMVMGDLAILCRGCHCEAHGIDRPVLYEFVKAGIVSQQDLADSRRGLVSASVATAMAMETILKSTHPTARRINAVLSDLTCEDQITP